MRIWCGPKREEDCKKELFKKPKSLEIWSYFTNDFGCIHYNGSSDCIDTDNVYIGYFSEFEDDDFIRYSYDILENGSITLYDEAAELFKNAEKLDYIEISISTKCHFPYKQIKTINPDKSVTFKF